MPRPFRTLRRETFWTLTRCRSKPRSFFGFVMMFMIRLPSRRDERRSRCAGNSRSGRYCPPSLPVSGHGRFGIFREQCGRLHDLPGLAKSTLRDVDLPPGFLNSVIARGMETFDGGDLPAGGVGDGGNAGAHGLLV